MTSETITPDAVRAALEDATPGPWEWFRGHSDWGLPRSNAVMPMGVSEYSFELMIAEVHSQTPYCVGASRKEAAQATAADANARLIAMAPDLATAYLALAEGNEREGGIVTDNPDLIARLRLPWPENGDGDDVTLPIWVFELLAEAADRIEALTALEDKTDG